MLKTLRESSPPKVRHDSGESTYRPSQLATPPGRELSLSGPRNRHSGRTGRKRALQPNRKDTYHMIAHTIKRIVCLQAVRRSPQQTCPPATARSKKHPDFPPGQAGDGSRRRTERRPDDRQYRGESRAAHDERLQILSGAGRAGPRGRVRPVAGQSPLLRGEPAASGHAQSAEGFHSAGRHSGGPRPDPLRTDRQRQQCVRHSAGRSGRTRGRRSLCPAAGYPGRYDRSDGAKPSHERFGERVSQPHDGRSGRPDAGSDSIRAAYCRTDGENSSRKP